MSHSRTSSPAFQHFLVGLLCVLFVSSVACAKRSRSSFLPPDKPRSALSQSGTANVSDKRININTASATELQSLPGIGEGLAQRIVDHREKYGPFRRVEHLMMVRGISDKRYRALRDLIAVE